MIFLNQFQKRQPQNNFPANETISHTPEHFIVSFLHEQALVLHLPLQQQAIAS